MSDLIRAFCDISEAIEGATYLNWPEVARLRPREGATHFPGSLYSFVTRRVSNAADEARIHAVASGKVSYETADTLVSALLTACQSVIALHIENGQLRQRRHEPFSVRALEPEAPPADAPLQDWRAHLARVERHAQRDGDLRLTMRSARHTLRKLSETIAACRERAAGEGVQAGGAPSPTVGTTVLATPASDKKSKGKHIDARMLQVLSQNPDAYGWTAPRWAEHLKCVPSTVKETKTWKETLKAIRAMEACEHAQKMDHSRKGRR